MTTGREIPQDLPIENPVTLEVYQIGTAPETVLFDMILRLEYKSADATTMYSEGSQTQVLSMLLSREECIAVIRDLQIVIDRMDAGFA